ncbi:DUF4181 domain-containing protein [Bacillus suaedae]|uniref:DUF4181 domain-containing protein n=1 Tax=Halalkalibacter suaedae TaxID=2822140 RepID=A0A941ATG5_9BACI|nr:DUF4181 domain-containing protein [Bacillus suaedae]MBP3951689.1 DUF4181 domain-containing protein [Bacillus suaedae]
MYGIEPNFWLRLIVLLTIVLLLLISFDKLMRTLFKTKKKKRFSYNHINEKHKKIDWIIRIATMVFLILGFVNNIMTDPNRWPWFLEPWLITFVFISLSEMVRAIFERKYAENPNDYKVTISQIVFILLLVFVLFQTDFFGLV